MNKNKKFMEIAAELQIIRHTLKVKMESTCSYETNILIDVQNLINIAEKKLLGIVE